MIKSKTTVFVAGLLVIGVCQAELANAEDRVDRNVKIMLEAARMLELSRASDGYAYLLVKQETVRAPVAVIFGYVDNAAACKEIAEVLSIAPRAGTFKCNPIY
ncbi:MAG TPA: hypothetical protein VGA60_03875 [Kiloniellales bacterium]|jgi:hypothetical protein